MVIINMTDWCVIMTVTFLPFVVLVVLTPLMGATAQGTTKASAVTLSRWDMDGTGSVMAAPRGGGGSGVARGGGAASTKNRFLTY